MKRQHSFLFVCLLLGSVFCFGQAQDGKLQIHHIDVGQGDGAVLITPLGQVVLFDMGEDLKRKDCKPAIAYLDQLGVKQVNYIFISHYHFDHIGCIPAVLKDFPLASDAAVYDRGFDYPGATYKAYVAAISDHRKQANVGDTVVLDKGSANPVTLKVVAVDGHSAHGDVSTANENDLSLSVLVTFGGFREEIGGDLSGDNTNMYQDVETPVASDVGSIDVYKVHHHCSSHSTNNVWLNATRPTVGIISTGDGNAYGHPAEGCLTRLHEAGLQKLFWTEQGVAAPATLEPGVDVIAGDIRIEVAPSATSYTVTYAGSSGETFQIKAQPSGGTGGSSVTAAGGVATPKYAWSKRSSKYHDANCPDVKKILAENLVESGTPPSDKTPASCVKPQN